LDIPTDVTKLKRKSRARSKSTLRERYEWASGKRVQKSIEPRGDSEGGREFFRVTEGASWEEPLGKPSLGRLEAANEALKLADDIPGGGIGVGGILTRCVQDREGNKA